MTDSPDAATEQAFETHDAFLAVDDAEDAGEGVVGEEVASEDTADYRVTTTAFEGTVAVPTEAGDDTTYAVVVRTPTLEAATSDTVGPAVAVGWFETFQKRLDDAPGATRHGVTLSAFGVAEDGDSVVVRYEFEEDNPKIAVEVAKTFTEYVEGTYVEGVVPGYEYEGAVADLIGQAASQGSESEAGGTPL